MIRRPPRSTLFPTRRSSDLDARLRVASAEREITNARRAASEAQMTVRVIAARSEEHTSELQSQSNLVCRLLLEKKKINARRVTPADTPRRADSAHSAGATRV